jgi:predicted dehydrogenase
LDAPEILNPDGTVAEDPQLLDALNHYATADVVDCVENGGEPVSSAREATAALEMIMAILEGQRTGARVKFPMETRQNPLGLWVQESQ